MTQKEPEAAVHLEQAMTENVRNDNAETRIKVYQELLFSDLLLALSDPETEEAKAATVANPQQLNIAILANPQGTKFAAVFTSPQAIRRWRPQGGQYATMRGQDIFKLLEPSPADVIAVNPGNSPIVILQKSEYRQLASGIVPKSNTSPVQVPRENPETENTGESAAPGQKQMQISFPTNVFSNEQKQRTHDVLTNHENIVAAAIGAIQPPTAPTKDSWIRTVFLLVQNIEPDQDNLKTLCQEIRDQIKQDDELFAECQFEVGVMPDEKFWDSLRQNNVLLFDKSTLAGQNAVTH